MRLLPELKRRPKVPGDTSRETAKWGWYILIVFFVLWLVYRWWFDN
ncbi:hypothetical protein [Hymenobacter sediminicola]|uniref:Uncharacterized protein n=1 Tax=Hymenobacter sediminicola TaxID=2761579 RepID=A0A7G7W3A0_9BACT|nr:hypothetical protein [Hymenobacter sediminicola]QNH60843.1 hypothetical protein H4317_11670 [Hymenobacter sediminicola]